MPKTTVKVDKDLVREAHELGLNVSKICENALKQAIEQLRPLYSKNIPKNCQNISGGVVPRAGFEPATTRSSAGRSPRLSYLGVASQILEIMLGTL